MLSGALRHAIDRSQLTEHGLLLFLAMTVGLTAGGGAILFRWLIGTFRNSVFLGAPGQSAGLAGWLADTTGMGPYAVVVPPVVGGLIMGPLIFFLAREARGHGVPEVMEAVALRGGAIRARVSVVKALASSICLGSGGSVGREGPICQIGSALGSTVGQLLHLSDARVKNLVACGAAGGIAATFNAPLAGVFFALEVIYGEFTAESFGSVAVASVSASVIGRLQWGDNPAFALSRQHQAAMTELPLFLVLGAIACLLALVFVRLLYVTEDLFDRIRMPEYAKPAVGGVALGLIGMYNPHLFGVGYGAIEAALDEKLLLGALLLLLVLKIAATSITLGSGGSGGVFAPSLFIGAMLGGAFALVIHHFAPGTASSPGAYALVGMAAAFAAASHAPITAVLIVFEMTREYSLILPLIFACGASTVLSRRISPVSIYTLKLIRRGIHVSLGHDVNLLNSITVADAMSTDLVTVRCDQTVREAAELLQTTKHHGFPVVCEQGKLHGVLTLQDIRRALADGRAEMPVGEVATREILLAFPDENLNAALRKLGLRDVGRLPVVAREDHSRLLGLVTRKNVIRAYNRALMRAHHGLHADADMETFE
ncbi:MAG: chloride channel protein [Armatimonadota bacterium]